MFHYRIGTYEKQCSQAMEQELTPNLVAYITVQDYNTIAEMLAKSRENWKMN